MPDKEPSDDQGDTTALLDEHQAAARLRVSVRTLRRWRLELDYGPPLVRVGRRVLYRPVDIDAWLLDQREQPGAPPSP